MTKLHYLKIMENREVFKWRLFSDSIPRGMNIKEINRQIQGGTTHYKAVSGAKSTQLNHHVTPTLEERRYAASMHVDIIGVIVSKHYHELDKHSKSSKQLSKIEHW